MPALRQARRDGARPVGPVHLLPRLRDRSSRRRHRRTWTPTTTATRRCAGDSRATAEGNC